MIDELKPYDSYRPADIPWGQTLPSHWELRRTKTLLRERVEKGFPTLPLLAATQTKGVVAKSDYGTRTVTATKDLHLLKLVEPGDFVISLRSFQGGLEIAHARGIISPAYTILVPRILGSRDYLRHFFKSQAFIEALTLFVTGIREGQNIDYSRLARAELPQPPPEEQAAIVRFLDHANRRVDQFIRSKKKLIALLNEQRQAIIHRAVTRGLDPNVKLKDSGVPWLGEVPAHWTLVPNRMLMRIRKKLVGLRHHEFQVLSLTKRGILVRDMDAGGKFSSFWERSQEVRPGDLVFCLFDVEETPRTVGLSSHTGMISGDYTVMEWIGDNRDTASFVELFYIAMDDRKLLSPMYSGLRKRIPKPEFLSVLTPIPPRDEIQTIVRTVVAASADAERAIDRLGRELELLSEYRTRLIADVVTGQLDVRAAAASLPDIEFATTPTELERDDETDIEDGEAA